jgi:E3 ubiquitin-protein transferase RMND5
MDILETELARLQRDATLSQSVEDVDKILEQLCRARDSIAAGEDTLKLCSSDWI